MATSDNGLYNVYRFFNTITGAHFFTSNEAEKDSVIANLPQFRFEGNSFDSNAAENAPGSTPVYRLYNLATNVHFYTANKPERNSLISSGNFRDEGISYYAYNDGSTAESAPLYRFFNTATGTHFYTDNEAEKDNIIATNPAFNFEGIAYYVGGPATATTITAGPTVEALVGTSGNDRFLTTSATLNTGDSFAGGAGTDTVEFQLTGGSASVPGGLTFQDIEQFVFSGTYAGGSIDASLLTSAQVVSQTGNTSSPANVINLASGTFVAFTDSKLKDSPVSVSYKAGATEANLRVTNVQDLSEITVLGGDLTTLNVFGSVAKNSSGGAGSLDLFMISQDLVSPSKLTTLNVNFTSDVNIIPHAVGALSLTTIDSSGSSGQLNMAAIALAGDGVTPLQDVLSVSSIKGGPGGSSIALALENFKASTLTLEAGTGNTTLRILDGIDASPTALKVVIKGGAGSNVLVFGDGPGPREDGLGNVKVVDEAGVRSGLISFENFDVTKDVINVSTFGTLDALTTSEKAAVSAAANLSTATELAVANAPNAFTVFDFGGNTYVVSDTNKDGVFSSGDGLIEIVGVGSAALSATALVTA